jgi:hypothetical protein
MIGQRKKSERGDYTAGTFFIVFLFVAGFFLAFKFFQAYMDKSKIESLLSATILQMKESGDDEIRARVVSDVKRTMGTDTDPAKVTIYRTSDRGRVRIEVPIDSPIKVAGYGWDLHLEAAVAESINLPSPWH